MQLAIAEAKKCISTETAFNVGAVLVKNNEILSLGYSREIEGNTHAEQCCLLKLKDVDDANGATIYSTMEPCGKRLSGNVPCAYLIVKAGINRVVQGIKEPETFVGDSIGTKILKEAGVVVEYLTGFEDQCLAVNHHLVDK
ncbi:DRAP deaminase [Boothiomyces sp. JEL0866]|nr:DRAP deaminase [Boothiomyces sp. JEL0866]